MKVYVAGANGAIGRRLVPQLIAAGHDVVGAVRSLPATQEMRSLGAEPVMVDGLDEKAVLDAVSRSEPEVVIHEMTSITKGGDIRHFDRWFAKTNELRTAGTDYLVRAAQLGGARRVIAQSFTGWNNIRDGRGVKTEEDPLDPNPPAAMQETIDAIRHLERTVTQADGLEGLALRYGSLYGPGSSMSDEYVDMVRARKLPLIGGGTGVWSFVHVDDAAAATVVALDHGTPGVYNIVDDDPAPASEWLPYLAEISGGQPPRRLPAWLGRLAAGEVAVSIMTKIRGSSNAKAKRELGWTPVYSSWREGFVSPSAEPSAQPRKDRRVS